MENRLKDKLWAYITENNPEVMFELQEHYSVSRYLDQKVKGIAPFMERLIKENLQEDEIETACLEEMTAELRPSRFLYIRQVVEKEFPGYYHHLRETGMLTYEVIIMMESCREIFTGFGFTLENQNDLHLYQAITAAIRKQIPKKKQHGKQCIPNQ